jgi:hypothetical protein
MNQGVAVPVHPPVLVADHPVLVVIYPVRHRQVLLLQVLVVIHPVHPVLVEKIIVL